MTSFITTKEHRGSGFTLLELLIVIAIIAVLAIALVFMLNPAETLKKARDAQRISDLKTIKTALGVMLTSTSTPSLDNFGAVCLTNGAGTANASAKIAYSVAPAPTINSGLSAGTDSNQATFSNTSYSAASQAAAGKIDGTGWIPVKLNALISGTPISAFPIDPVNLVGGTATSSDLVYRYACQNGSTTSKPSYVFEIDAQLESNAYTVEDNKKANDGGDNASYFETGNSLYVLPTTANF